MILKKVDRIMPLGKLFKLIISLAASIQIILILYNHYSGFYLLSGFLHFIQRLSLGIVLSTIAGFMITIPDLLVIDFLNRKFPWNRRILTRASLQFIFAIIFAVIASTTITLISHSLGPYEQGLVKIIWLNALIASVVNLIVMAILEALLYFDESNQAKSKAEVLERELFRIRFEVLKNQINPHFMFNSLNVLSGLVDKDVEKAQVFIGEFAHIYRYVLETIEKQVVTLDEELGFVRSYIYLQQIRYGDAIQLTVNVPAIILKLLMPPLSLQLVLENAIKHNIISTTQPLTIEIYYEGKWLFVRNNIQSKVSSGRSTGVGQTNLTKRYMMITNQVPEFNISNSDYIVKLPLIKTEYNKHTNY
jgi:LytS/YehU family sensor histidine kinase